MQFAYQLDYTCVFFFSVECGCPGLVVFHKWSSELESSLCKLGFHLRIPLGKENVDKHGV